MKTSPKSNLGNKNKAARAQAAIALAGLKGLNVQSMTNKQKDDLLTALLQLLGLVDEKGVVK